MGGAFSTGGSKSSSKSFGATKEGLDYLDRARQNLGEVTPGMIEQTLQQRLANLSSTMGNMASMNQIQGRINAQGGIPGATNSAGTQALMAAMPFATQMRDQAYAQAGQQQLGLQELLGQLAAQYAGLTGYSTSKGKAKNPGWGWNVFNPTGVGQAAAKVATGGKNV